MERAQRMTVTVDGNRLYDWPISTGGGGNETPSGAFKAADAVFDLLHPEWRRHSRHLRAAELLVVRSRTAAFGYRGRRRNSLEPFPADISGYGWNIVTPIAEGSGQPPVWFLPLEVSTKILTLTLPLFSAA